MDLKKMKSNEEYRNYLCSQDPIPIADTNLDPEEKMPKTEEEEIKKIDETLNRKEDFFPMAIAGKEFGSKERDSRSIFIGNVDYDATEEELEKHFYGCGPIIRNTIQYDKYSNYPKGFAYIEFLSKESVSLAITLDQTFFRGRQIKVMQKRTNRPGIRTTNRPPAMFMDRSRYSYRRGQTRGASYGRGRPAEMPFYDAQPSGTSRSGGPVKKFLRSELWIQTNMYTLRKAKPKIIS